MMPNKKKKFPTDKEQRVAADIIIDLYFASINSQEDLFKRLKELEENYGLMEDPFTHLPCSCKEYEENYKEYNKQLMEEKYGYYDII